MSVEQINKGMKFDENAVLLELKPSNSSTVRNLMTIYI